MRSEDELKAWTLRNRSGFDQLEPRADLWAAIEQQLPPADDLRAFTQQHRDAFDVLEPRPALWEGIDRQLATPATERVVQMQAARGGADARPLLRSWWQAAAAAVVVFGLGYGLRMEVEPTSTGGVVAERQEAVGGEPGENTGDARIGYQSHGFASTSTYRAEPDPALNASILTGSTQATDEVSATTADDHPQPEQIAPEIARLEARYDALLTRRRAELRRFGPARPLADEWDREMAVLDSTYAELRHELTRNPNTDDVVEAMARNLRLRMELLDQQARTLEAVQQARHRAERLTPHKPPSVNPDANGSDDPSGWIAPPTVPGGVSTPAEPHLSAPASKAAASVRRPVTAV